MNNNLSAREIKAYKNRFWSHSTFVFGSPFSINPVLNCGVLPAESMTERSNLLFDSVFSKIEPSDIIIIENKKDGIISRLPQGWDIEETYAASEKLDMGFDKHIFSCTEEWSACITAFDNVFVFAADKPVLEDIIDRAGGSIEFQSILKMSLSEISKSEPFWVRNGVPLISRSIK